MLHFNDNSSKFYKKRNSLNSQLTFYKTNRMTFHTNYLLQLETKIAYSSKTEVIFTNNILKIIENFIRFNLNEMNKINDRMIEINDAKIETILQNEEVKEQVCYTINEFTLFCKFPKDRNFQDCVKNIFNENYKPNENCLQQKFVDENNSWNEQDYIEFLFWEEDITQIEKFLQSLELI